MIKFVRSIDFFGEPVSVYINKQKTVRTLLGGTFSIIMGILIIIFSWIIGKDIYYKDNPFSYQQSSYYEPNPTILIESCDYINNPKICSSQDDIKKFI